MPSKELLQLLNLTEEDFKPSKDKPTIDDLVDALNILTSIILEDEEDD